MVIGDSAAQGCQGLSVTKLYASQGHGSWLAKGAKWSFTTPDYPKPVLWDLHSVLSRFDGPASVLKELRRVKMNAKWWLNTTYKGSRENFDNLGLTGCLITDLWERTWQTSHNAIEEKRSMIEDGSMSLKDYANMHLDILARYVLNPKKLDKYKDFAPLDWVVEKKPKRLIVHVGHNHGFFAAAFSADMSPYHKDNAPNGFRKMSDIKKQFKTLGEKLDALPEEVSEIYVLLIPKVSPCAALSMDGPIDASGYAEEYTPMWGLNGSNSLTRAEAQNADKYIRQFNQTFKSEVQAVDTKGRVKFVDIYSLFEGIDFKQTGDVNKRIKIGTRLSVDNRFTKFIYRRKPGQSRPPRPPFPLTYKQGGFQSIDGVHPSAVGHAYIATKVAQEMGVSLNSKKILSDAYKADLVMSDFPRGLNDLMALMNGTRFVGGLFSRAEEETLLEIEEAGGEDPTHLAALVMGPFAGNIS